MNLGQGLWKIKAGRSGQESSLGAECPQCRRKEGRTVDWGSSVLQQHQQRASSEVCPLDEPHTGQGSSGCSASRCVLTRRKWEMQKNVAEIEVTVEGCQPTTFLKAGDERETE